MILLSPEQHTDYQLIDTGGFEKLERFGPYILSRPEPQAIWDKSMTEQQWADQSNAVFKRDKNSQEKGQWVKKKQMPGNSKGYSMSNNVYVPIKEYLGEDPYQFIEQHTKDFPPNYKSRKQTRVIVK